MRKLMLIAMLLLVCSIGAKAVTLPIDGDLWTEDTSLIGSWSSGNGGAVAYVSDDVAVGTYAVKNTNPNTSYFAGLAFKIPGAPLDLSNAASLMSFKMKLTFSSGLEYVNVQYRIYTDAALNSNFYMNDKLSSESWSLYTSGMNIHDLFTGVDGSPDLSHVYGVGLFVTQNMPGVATTVAVDGLNFVVPEPATVSILLVGGIMAAYRRRKNG